MPVGIKISVEVNVDNATAEEWSQARAEVAARLQQQVGSGGVTAPITTSPWPLASPENSVRRYLGGGKVEDENRIAVVDMKPIYDKNGVAWALNPTVPAYADHECEFIQGGVPGGAASILIVRQGQVYWGSSNNTASFYWNAPNGSGGSMTVTLPGAWVPAPTPTPGPPIPAPQPGGMPADPPHSSTTPGSGKVTTAVASDTLVALVAAAAPGDTIKLVAGQVYAESVVLHTPLLIDGNGAILDGTGIAYAEGKGGIVTKTDATIKSLEIRNFGITETQAGLTSGIRIDGPGWVEVDDCHIHHCQDGIGGGQIGYVLTINRGQIDNCGIDDGHTHNIYVDGIRLVLNGLVSINPNGGHAAKSRSLLTAITGGELEAANGSCLDLPDGSAAVCVLDGVTFTKPAGASDHKVLGYCLEDQSKGTAGVQIKNSTLNLLCDMPLVVAFAGTVAFDGTNAFTGNKPTSQGGGTVTGLPA